MTSRRKSDLRREEIIEAAAAHLIEHGLHDSGLRAMARTVGISDRMIMYYFETKETLVAEALLLISERLAAGTDAALPKGNATARQALAALSATLQSAEAQAVMRLWFEIIGLAMRGQEPYARTAAMILERSETQIRGKLRADQKHRAREVLSALEGEVMVSLLRGV